MDIFKLLRRLAKVCAIFSFGVAMCGTAGAALIAYEGFDYATGSIDGRNGGTGWTSAWDNPYLGSVLTNGGTGLTYPDLAVSGGSATWAPTTSITGISAGRRYLTSQSSGNVWISFLGDFQNATGGTDNLRFYNDASLTGGVGGNSGGTGNWYLFDQTLQPSNAADTGVSINSTGTHLGLLQIDYNAGQTTLWMDPILTSFDGTGGVTLAIAPLFNNIQLFSRSGAIFDELRIGTTAVDVGVSVVPLPAAAWLFGTALIGLVGFGKRRKSV